MEYKNLSNSYHFDLYTSASILKYFFILCLAYLTWKLFRSIYEVVTTSYGLHYVSLERKSIPMTTSYNPFFFDVHYHTASYSGIKCILKSEQECYVQAFWGVPIASLFEFLYGDWQSMVNSLLTDIPSRKFSSKCVCSNERFILLAGEEKTVEFNPPWNISDTAVSQEVAFMRKVYPFVVLMLLKEKDDISEESHVVVMASAIHVPDNNLLLYPQLIGQYIKLGSGQLGQIKKIFLSSPASSEEDGEAYDLCLACYHRPVSVVFLPCRHACLCRVCFDLCHKCPICRMTSFNYFELHDVHGEAAH